MALQGQTFKHFSFILQHRESYLHQKLQKVPKQGIPIREEIATLDFCLRDFI